MKVAALLLCSASLLFAQLREGNFSIRFEPTAVMQSKVQVPFEIRVMDANSRPLTYANVDLEIARADGSHSAKFKAVAEDTIKLPGVYTAKPVFPEGGPWNVTARAERHNLESNRTIQFNVQE
ncbi:MAG TPA: FixH family protein [Bryobacteraceae bacterium]|nr:FixH family protein [Bryobacteraceae bacterium]